MHQDDLPGPSPKTGVGAQRPLDIFPTGASLCAEIIARQGKVGCVSKFFLTQIQRSHDRIIANLARFDHDKYPVRRSSGGKSVRVSDFPSPRNFPVYGVRLSSSWMSVLRSIL